MNILRIIILGVLSVSFFASGCSDALTSQEEGVTATPESSTSNKASQTYAEKNKSADRGQGQSLQTLKFDDLPNSAVLIAVNGTELTKETFLKWVDLRKQMLSVSSFSHNMAGNDSTLIIKEQMLASVTNDYVGQIVAIDYAKAIGLTAGTNHVDACRKAFLLTTQIGNMPWEKALKKFNPAQRATINDRIAAEATVAAVSDYFFKTNNVEVGQAEIDALYNSYREYNRACATSNTVVWANASNIWNRVRAGESFEELAAKYDEDEYREENGVWGDFTITDFTDEPEIWKLSSKFRPGWVSPPVEADNGITILKINSIIDGAADVNAANYVPSPAAEINISRIFLHLPLPIEKTDKAQFAKECQRAKKIASFNAFLAGLVSKAAIKYPCGTAIFGQQEGDGPVPFIAK